jgi:phage repressor protein C with HTH and peptisase S24 domain
MRVVKPVERLYQYFDYKGIKPTAFEKEIGISNGYFGKTYRKKASIGSDIIKTIIENSPDLNLEWLIMGTGDMIKAENNEAPVNKNSKTEGKDPDKNEGYKKNLRLGEVEEETPPFKVSKRHKQVTAKAEAPQRVPLYNIETTAGLVPLFNDAVKQEPVDFIAIPNLAKCDGAIHVTGDNMYPLLKSGDIVLYRQISDIANDIFWGEMYLVSIDMEGEEYVTVRYIQKGEQQDHIKLVSHNEHHSDKEVHISKVRALAFVKASIRINSMK